MYRVHGDREARRRKRDDQLLKKTIRGAILLLLGGLTLASLGGCTTPRICRAPTSWGLNLVPTSPLAQHSRPFAPNPIRWTWHSSPSIWPRCEGANSHRTRVQRVQRLCGSCLVEGGACPSIRPFGQRKRSGRLSGNVCSGERRTAPPGPEYGKALPGRL